LLGSSSRKRETVLEDLLLATDTALPLFNHRDSPHYAKLKPLDVILQADTPDTASFKDMLRHALALDPHTRLTPENALLHPFILNAHMQSPSSHP
jgi:serine/threonine protein kinase